ncbi:dipeptidase [Paenibacillus sp. NEAU-GSW1]|uniref:dipeptidase n=1 Tax=Paenibacillus sp. NEAU-GSW1 TaxID=2682486 RepID=UPI0012E16564|nr:dipeptidase [Paenibacillus sp. NEAU-GSW1]MUT66430.1 membrane dipeptidase [Paenibacillus sp. NEAU-GSW1]
MNNRIVDFHCDVLTKLLQNPDLSFRYNEGELLDASYERLKQAGTVLQTFAIYIPQSLNGPIEPILESISLFYEKVLTCPDIQLVKTKSDLDNCLKSGSIGAMLSLEGIDGMQGNIPLLRVLYELGIRAAGLTWNHANWAADGVMEERGGGLTSKGKAFVRECDRLGIIVDVSHLSERAFWDTADTASKTIIASHSNCKRLMGHPRNLTDEQIKAIIALQGMVGVTFVPYFVADGERATIDDVLRHVEHICELGGSDHLMFGSDFDGIDRYVDGLTHPGEVDSLREALLKRYSAAHAEAFMSGNALRFLSRVLPD